MYKISNKQPNSQNLVSPNQVVCNGCETFRPEPDDLHSIVGKIMFGNCLKQNFNDFNWLKKKKIAK